MDKINKNPGEKKMKEENLKRMEGLVATEDLKIFIEKGLNMVNDLREEGFEDVEIDAFFIKKLN